MNSRILEIADEIVAREGGYVNDPADPGGATKHGVTIHTLRRLKLDLDGDGDVDIADVRMVTPQHAREIFLRHYFEQPKICDLPECLHETVFDMYVNAGSRAVKILQSLLCEMGQKVSVDGMIGPQTQAACVEAQKSAQDFLTDAYGIARRNYYYRLGDRRPSLRKFARRRDGGKGGWIVRAETFISAKYHLSEAEHRARVAAWA